MDSETALNNFLNDDQFEDEPGVQPTAPARKMDVTGPSLVKLAKPSPPAARPAANNKVNSRLKEVQCSDVSNDEPGCAPRGMNRDGGPESDDDVIILSSPALGPSALADVSGGSKTKGSARLHLQPDDIFDCDGVNEQAGLDAFREAWRHACHSLFVDSGVTVSFPPNSNVTTDWQRVEVAQRGRAVLFDCVWREDGAEVEIADVEVKQSPGRTFMYAPALVSNGVVTGRWLRCLIASLCR
jgi:hypothetical protein